MSENEVLIATLIDESWLTLEQAAAACDVEVEWLKSHLEAGLFPHAVSVSGLWRLAEETLRRARRMRALERDFDAVPELAALVADLIEETDRLRTRLSCLGEE